MKNEQRSLICNQLLLASLAIAMVAGCGKKSVPIPPAPAVDIHSAVVTGDLASIQGHIAAQSDLNVQDAMTQSTPLMNAAVFGQIEIGTALIDAGADLDIKNQDGSTALISATFFGYPELVRALLDKGADPNLRNNSGGTALNIVEGPWETVKPIYDFVGNMLTPMGVNLDYERIKASRTEIATLLSEAVGKRANDPGASAKPKVAIEPDVPIEPIELVDPVVPFGDERYLTMKSDYLFDQSKLPTFELDLPPSSLARIDSDPSAEEYVEGTLTFEGETVSPVGVRYKGSIGAWIGGLSGANPMNPSGHKTRTKLSMKIKFNGIGSDKTFYGLNKLQFHSMSLDPTQMRERLGYLLFREMGVPAPRCVHARLVINGTYSGLYALVEQIDARFTHYNFPNGEGNLYKEIWPIDSNGQPLPESKYLAKLKTNEGEGASVARMQRFGEAIAGASDSQLTEVVEGWMDIDRIVALAVVDRAIRNDDGPFHWYCFGSNCTNHNYYWYEDPVEEQFHLIPWDLDSAFENIIEAGNPMTPIADAWGQSRSDCEPFGYGPFRIPQRSAACDKLTKAWTMYESEYADLKARFNAGPFSTGQVTAHLDAWVAQVREATDEAIKVHDDALSMVAWEGAVEQLREQLEHARAN